MALMGVDIGTSTCKANVFSPDGTILGSGRSEYPTMYPKPGHTELDAGLVFDRVCEAIGNAVRETAADGVAEKRSGARNNRPGSERPSEREIEAICFTSMGEAVVPVSTDRRILGPSILGSDARGAEYVSRLTDRFEPDELYQVNPNIPGPNYTMPKLCWIREHDPELYNRTAFFLHWADCLPFLLGCEPVTNYAHANRTLLFDIRSEDWADELVEAAGIDRDKFAPTVPSGHVLGRISGGAASMLDLPNRPVVVAGAHDQCCNAVGAGVIEPGDAVCGIGTVECITPVYDRIPDAGRMRAAGLNIEHHAVCGRYVSFIYNQAGMLVRWFRDTFVSSSADAESVPAYGELFAELPDGPSELLVLPYFEPTGAPKFISDASGVIAGLKPDTSRSRILKGILEGETFYFVESLSLLESLGVGLKELAATGGGARSDPWLQLKADILGIPIVRLDVIDAGTLGAAIVAGNAIGVFDDIARGVAATRSTAERFEPNSEMHRRYEKWYLLYTQLYPALAGIMREMHKAAREK